MDPRWGHLYLDWLFYTTPTIAVGHIKNGRIIPPLMISRPTVQHDRSDKDGPEEPYHPSKPNSKLVHVSLISLHAENSTIDGKKYATWPIWQKRPSSSAKSWPPERPAHRGPWCKTNSVSRKVKPFWWYDILFIVALWECLFGWRGVMRKIKYELKYMSTVRLAMRPNSDTPEYFSL